MTTSSEAQDAESLEDAACPMGCQRDDDVLFVGRDLLHGLPGEFPVVRCRGCGLVRTTPRPKLAALGSYYPECYGPHLGGEGEEHRERDSSLRNRFLRWARLDGTRDLLPPGLKPGRALEIGCATGDFLAKLRSHGWQSEGIEPSGTAAQRARARGFAVYSGPLETAPEPSSMYDLVVGSHVFEHLSDPVDSLGRLRAWSRPGAWLALSVPDVGAFLFPTFRAAWYDLDLPRHLFHYEFKTLAAMLVRTGWHPVRRRSQATLNGFMGSLGRVLVSRPGGFCRRLGSACGRFPESRSLFKKILSPPLETTLSVLHQTGRMVVWARAV